MDEELELLVTAVVAADGAAQARAACRALQERVGGRVVETVDCSDEDPGCWSVTVRVTPGERVGSTAAAALSRSVRSLLRALGPGFATGRVSCEPPTAWTVVDDPDLVALLVPGGERLLVEAWTGTGWQPASGDFAPGTPDLPESDAEPEPVDDGTGPRLRLWVDVATDREAGAQWQSRAVASRVTREARLTGVARHATAIRVGFDLGRVDGDPARAVERVVAALGGTGWTPPERTERTVVSGWRRADPPMTGVVAVEVAAEIPSPVPR
ncbi:hypothetical protein LX15_005776 [Streptoalloteichus tenebrarius]|uniref:Uncharacterized protein n=1 Tax=Streptoalloteichus tenebrarius (strain ATCC 17920 / DSM 40477 / JCM 4838 / CBS 697.72 / NBRC 16177 / NCIMB 11028 / NRRL B-12390 / A12253. 1 / ISP 5477) TaxID=1933 RepID=A0ABT1I2Q7_STRSD|nr:hypothetical protein [Streptoalloteichus tenebrarius]MCP2262044.1 hypothetical protein [Streptoalloteichus tenebrarius]BFF01316.1 hypothetical protein GCM10020241_29910 [Streptoalloteichus tenebrarius]